MALNNDSPASALRLGVMTAVIDESRRVLLSQRSDLKVWNLPGGRLDAGESVVEAAAREVQEETGLIVEMTHPVGLYYLAGWERLNILFAARPVGGSLLSQSDETTNNRFFAADAMPEMLWRGAALDALAERRPLPQVMTIPAAELRRVKARLRWRWLMNWLRRRPEPRFPVFQVSTVGVIWNKSRQRLLTLPGAVGRQLPRVFADRRTAPWQQLSAYVQGRTGYDALFQWVGVWQDVMHDRLEFIFAATIGEQEILRGGEWTLARAAALTEQEMEYVERVKPGYHVDPIWLIRAEAAPNTLQGR